MQHFGVDGEVGHFRRTSQCSHHRVCTASDAALEDEFVSEDISLLHVPKQEVRHVSSDGFRHGRGVVHDSRLVRQMSVHDAFDVLRQHLDVGHADDFNGLRDAHRCSEPRVLDFVDVVHPDDSCGVPGVEFDEDPFLSQSADGGCDADACGEIDA